MNITRLNTLNDDKVIVRGNGGNSGGGSVTPTELKRNDVNFFDYDGTLLYAYTWDEAKNLTELPPAPSHDGLVFQEWNYTLEAIKMQGSKYIVFVDGALYIYVQDLSFNGKTYSAYHHLGTFTHYVDGNADYAILVDDSSNKMAEAALSSTWNSEDYTYSFEIESIDEWFDVIEKGEIPGKADVGANYTTSDSYTRIYVESKGGTYSVSGSGNVEIDWGDGTIETNFGSHVYEVDGDYIITVSPTAEYIRFSSSDGTIVKSHVGQTPLNKECEYGQFVSLPANISIDFSKNKYDNSKLLCLVVPRTFTGDCYFQCVSGNGILSLPNTNDPYVAYITCKTNRLVIPKGFHFGQNYESFKNSIIENLYINGANVGWNLLYNYSSPNMFFNVYAGPYIDCYDNDILSVGNLVLSPLTSCLSFVQAVYVDCSECRYVPYLGGIDADVLKSVIVPKSLYNEFANDTNWSTVADKFIINYAK